MWSSLSLSSLELVKHIRGFHPLFLHIVSLSLLLLCRDSHACIDPLDDNPGVLQALFSSLPSLFPAPQFEHQLSCLQGHWTFLLLDQVCCWAHLVNFPFQSLYFSAPEFLLAFLKNFYLLVNILLLYMYHFLDILYFCPHFIFPFWA